MVKVATLVVASASRLCGADDNVMSNADERLTMLQLKTKGEVAVNNEQFLLDSYGQEAKTKSQAMHEKQLAFVQNLAKSMVGSNETIDDTAKDALHAIDETLKNSLQILQDSHNTAMSLLNTLAGRVRSCHTSFLDANAENADAKDKVDEQKDTHRKCRTKLTGEIDDRNTKCDDLDIFVGGLTPPSCGIPDEDLTVYWRNYKSFQDNNYDTWKIKKDLCDAATTTGENTEDTCDGNQEDFESGLCALRLTVVSACETYDSCYTVSKSDFDAAVVTTQFQEGQRKVEWTAVKKIQCYIQILLSDEEITMDDIQTCVDLEPNVDLFDVVVPDVPPPQECDVSGVVDVPCGDGFIVNYEGMPGLDNCQACPVLPPHLQAVLGLHAPAAVTPSTAVQMIDQQTGKAVTFLNGCSDLSDAENQKWELRACIDEALCQSAQAGLGVPHAWSHGDQPLKSGGVVAWFSVSGQRVADCAWPSGCTSQAFPPPTGHWGTPYKIWKVNPNDHTVIDDGSSITLGDTVAFTRMWQGVHSDKMLRGCTNARGTSDLLIGGQIPSPPESFEIRFTTHTIQHPALTPQMKVVMTTKQEGKAVSWLNQCASPDGSEAQKWQLRACTNEAVCKSDQAALGNPIAWTGDQPITSGTPVAWFSVSAQRVADCAGGGCTSQPFPPPNGHWGTPYKIWKVNPIDHTIVDDGSVISIGDTVAFTRMYSGTWSNRMMTNCGAPGSNSEHASGTLPSPPEQFEFTLTVTE